MAEYQANHYHRARSAGCRFEYVTFSDSARKNAIPQFLDNRSIYGYLTLDENADSADALSRDIACERLKMRTCNMP